MVEHIALTTRSSPLYLLHRMSIVHRYDTPRPRRSFPSQELSIDIFRHIHDRPNGLTLRISHHTTECRTRFGGTDVLTDFRLAITLYNGIGPDQLRSGISKGHGRSAKRPSRTVIHVNINSFLLSDGIHGLQGIHPVVTEICQGMVLIALNSIYRRDFKCANACLCIIIHALNEILLINGRPHEPPTTTSL